jgi:vesicle coat complex subunit
MASPGYFSEAGKKSEVNELKKLLEQAAIQRDPVQYKKVIQRVIACMTLGMDMSSLFMQMIMVFLTKLVNRTVKKYCFVFIAGCSGTQVGWRHHVWGQEALQGREGGWDE